MRIPAFGALLLALSTAQAALNDLGNGLVADTDQGIHWLKDANIVWTACNATSGPEKALWDAFDPENNPGGMGVDDWGLPRNKQWICDYNGAMHHAEAVVWIQLMNLQVYLGHANWRLPNTPQPDATCESQLTAPPYPNQGYGYNCRGSELGHLFNVSLSNPNHGGTGSTGGTVGTSCESNYPVACLSHSGPFINTRQVFQGNSLYPNNYWSTQYEPNFNRSWEFSFGWGTQGTAPVGDTLQVWPVSSLEPQPVPLLPTLGLATLSTLLFLLGLRRLRSRRFGGRGG